MYFHVNTREHNVHFLTHKGKDIFSGEKTVVTCCSVYLKFLNCCSNTMQMFLGQFHIQYSVGVPVGFLCSRTPRQDACSQMMNEA